jgi:phosphate transport system substrate-binding protein
MFDLYNAGSREAFMRYKCLVLCLLSCLVIAFTGCGGGTGPGEQHRPVTVKGSDTMVILAQSWAENYMKEHPGLSIQVTGGGSGVGIAALINGGTDICEASRPMKQVEKDQVRTRHGKDVKEIPVALDGLAVYVSESNPIKSLTEPQLKAIYTGRAMNWREVGGKDARIVAYGRENSSGTYQFFKEHVLNNEDFFREVQTLPGTGAIVNAVANDAASIGYGGIAYASGIRVVPVRKDDTSEAVMPSLATVKSGEYPLSRNLFFYTIGEPSGDIQSFIDWVLGQEGQKLCETVGYYPIVQK